MECKIRKGLTGLLAGSMLFLSGFATAGEAADESRKDLTTAGVSETPSAPANANRGGDPTTTESPTADLYQVNSTINEPVGSPTGASGPAPVKRTLRNPPKPQNPTPNRQSNPLPAQRTVRPKRRRPGRQSRRRRARRVRPNMPQGTTQDTETDIKGVTAPDTKPDFRLGSVPDRGQWENIRTAHPERVRDPGPARQRAGAPATGADPRQTAVTPTEVPRRATATTVPAPVSCQTRAPA